MPVRSRLAAPPRRRGLRGHLTPVLALRHHAVAVLREFKGPIVAFLVVTVAGGFLYGELYRLARGVHIPLIDRPYVMVQLMFLETPEPVPPEWYLVAFWYLLPAVFVVLVGLGAADFVDLFFNRDDDRDRWSEALAMTYRNHTVVLGAGHVGLRVVRDLRDMGIEVVVVDLAPSEEAQELLQRLDVPTVAGDGTRTETLERARLTTADSFVACTSDDLVNLQACSRARKVNPDVRVVARIWDVELAEDHVEMGRIDTLLSAADLSAPAFAGAAAGLDISQTIEVAGEEYSTVRLKVRPGSFMEGGTVAALQEEEDVDLVLLSRQGRADVHPGPETRLVAGDDVVLFARHVRVLELVARNRKGRK